MLNASLLIFGAVVITLSSGFEYYLIRAGDRRNEDLEKDLDRLNSKDQIKRDELPAIGASKEQHARKHRLAQVGTVLGFILIITGSLLSVGAI